MTVVKFPTKKPASDAKSGPYWAGQPMKDAFPNKADSKPVQPRRTSLIVDGELYFIVEDGPEGAA